MTVVMLSSEVQVVLVEDDAVDAEAVRRAFRRRRIGNPIHLFSDGTRALQALRGRAGSAPIPAPQLILLDLNMPRMNGLEFLRELRGDPLLRDSRVFVLTTSNDERDRAAVGEIGVDGYFVKARVEGDLPDLLLTDTYSWMIVEDNTG